MSRVVTGVDRFDSMADVPSPQGSQEQRVEVIKTANGTKLQVITTDKRSPPNVSGMSN